MKCVWDRQFGTWVCVVACVLLGCSPSAEAPGKPKLSYAEALAIYNQEVAALDRLQVQKKSLQQQLEMPSLGSVSDILESAGDINAELGRTLEELGQPGGARKSAPDAKAKTKADPGKEEEKAPEGDPAPDPLQQLSAQLKAAEQKQLGQRDEIEKQIADLDVQIAEQQTRVDRAKADREAAEARR